MVITLDSPIIGKGSRLSLPEKDTGDCRLGHPEPLAYIYLTHLSAKLSDAVDFILGQLGFMQRIVLRSCHRLQVIGVDTARSLTAMVQHKMLWQRSVLPFVDDLMRHAQSIAKSDTSVPVIADVTQPNPASTRFIDYIFGRVWMLAFVAEKIMVGLASNPSATSIRSLGNQGFLAATALTEPSGNDTVLAHRRALSVVPRRRTLARRSGFVVGGIIPKACTCLP